MKFLPTMIKKLFIVPAIFATMTFAVFAQEKNDLPAPEAPNIRGMAMIFQMSDDELDKLAIAIERIRKIPQAQRQQMAQEMQRCEHAKNRAEKNRMMKKMRSRFQKEQCEILDRYYATLDAETAQKEREAFVKMSQRERHEFINKAREKLGVPTLPPPPPLEKSV